MPIPDDLHDDARHDARRCDPQKVARQLGLDSASEQHKYSCPFCSSSDAFHVNGEKYAPDGGGRPAAKCFSCGETCNDTIDLLEKVDGCDYLDALEELSSYQLRDRTSPSGADTSGASPSTADTSTERDVDGRHGEPSSPDTNDSPTEAEIAERARQARQTLRDAWQRLDRDVVAPLAYLKTRGIPRDLARWAGVRPLPANYWRDLLEDIGPKRAVDAGIYNVDGGHAHPSSSSMAFAYQYRTEEGVEFDTLRFREPRDGKGDEEDESIPVLSVCSNASCTPGEVAPTMPRSPYLAPFAVPAAIEEGSPLYVVEGEIDTLSLWRCGRHAVGAPGAHSWRDAWCEGWRDVPYVIALGDGDGAGEDFADDVEASLGRVYGARWRDRHFIKRTVNGGDINDLLQAHGEEWLSDLLARLETQLDSHTKTPA